MLNNFSKILDVGCGKGYLLYEIKQILPNINIHGFDISSYAINNSKKEVKKYLFKYDARKIFPFKNNFFDLTISLGTLHNFSLSDLERSIKEIQRVSKKKYIMVESFRNDKELFNLQCWALTCRTFFSVKDWIWFYNYVGYNGDYEFIFFN
jgi:ubiquinone/menaquinone biosynthesis C-methylase UbiE